MVPATATSRNRKIQKKTSSSSGVPHSGEYGATESSGQPPGANCKNTSDCAIPSGLDHAVCRDVQCQSGASGSSCGVTSDCVVPPGLDHAVCRQGKCQRGVCYDYCGQHSDCISGLQCDGTTNIAKCHSDGFIDVLLSGWVPNRGGNADDKCTKTEDQYFHDYKYRNINTSSQITSSSVNILLDKFP